MNDRYGDNRNDRWRERGQYGRGSGGGWDRGDRGSGGGRDYGRGDDDRGFFDRAGDEVRSWFGDEEAERRREADARREQSEYGYGGGRVRSNRDDDFGSAGYRGTGGGWGNQSADSWNRDRPGERAGSHDRSYLGGSDYDRDFDRNRGRQRYSDTGGEPNSASTWGPSPFGGGGDEGRRFDRVDAGHTGTHGAHPFSAPVGGAYGGGNITPSGGRSGSSYARYAQGQRGGSGGGSQWGGQDHDPHYSEWRNRQIENLDRDYDEYRREHQSKFEQEFGTWRNRRTEQRQHLNRASEHMEVVGSDGEHVGTVDKARGDRIILTRTDQDAGGHHHSIPCSWIERVDDKVTINKTAAEAKQAWRDEENNRALFERDDDEQQNQGNNGPHTLNRSFSGTY